MKSSLETELRDGIRTVVLNGSINALNSQLIGEQIEACADGWNADRVILGLSGVDYVSSAALRIFMSLWQKAKAAGCELVLAEPTPEVREVLELTGFQNIFRIEETLEQARS